MLTRSSLRTPFDLEPFAAHTSREQLAGLDVFLEDKHVVNGCIALIDPIPSPDVRPPHLQNFTRLNQS